MRKKISFKYPFILSILTASFLLSGSGYGNDGYFAHPYAEDDRLEFLEKNTYSPDMPENNGNFYLIDENRYFYSCAHTYTEKEIASFPHTQFDEQGRLIYTLGYTPEILKENCSYCEETIYEWNEAEYSCRYINYNAQSNLIDNLHFYVAYRQMFEVTYCQFREDGRLLSYMTYRPTNESDSYPYYSDELYFDRGYQAEYEDDLLMTELLCYNLWGMSESGNWEHRIYQYDERDRCILKITTGNYEIIVQRYEYDDAANQTTRYTYRVKQDWEVTLDDGSLYSFDSQGYKPNPMVKKVSPDGQTELEFFNCRTCDLGQEPYLMPDEIEATVRVHKYVVQPGDCLWKIARDYYGYDGYSSILYRANRSLIGGDPDMLETGLCLYLPETGTPGNTDVPHYYY